MILSTTMCKFFAIFCLSGPATAVDGDTLKIDQQSVRLWGVDAPELSEPFGLASKRILEGIIAGKTVACRPIGRSYRRIVARCFVGTQDVAELLVRSGAALDCFHYSSGTYRQFEPKEIRTQLVQKPYC